MKKKTEQKWHFSQWEENKQKRNQGKQKIKPVRLRKSNENMGAKWSWEGQRPQLVLMASCCFILSSGKWHMGLGGKKYNDSRIICFQMPFLDSLFLVENWEHILPETEHLAAAALKSALAACGIFPPPSWSSPPVSHAPVISAVPTWSGQLFTSYTLEDESLKLFLTKQNDNLFVKLPELSLFTWRISGVKEKVSF